MKTTIIIMLILTSMLFLTACSQENNTEDQMTGDVVRTELSPAEPVVKDLEVLYINEQFFPETFYVDQGDHVRLFVKNTEIIYITMPDYIESLMKEGYVEFDADETGTFEFYCQNCEEPAIGVIHVI